MDVWDTVIEFVEAALDAPTGTIVSAVPKGMFEE